MKSDFYQQEDSNNNSKDTVSPLCEIINLMFSVELDSPEAELNATTISDGNGGRILL